MKTNKTPGDWTLFQDVEAVRIFKMFVISQFLMKIMYLGLHVQWVKLNMIYTNIDCIPNSSGSDNLFVQ